MSDMASSGDAGRGEPTRIRGWAGCNRRAVHFGTRGFKTDEGWRETDSLAHDDLLPAAKLLDMPHGPISLK
jgi:hypothetical protein